MKKIIFAVFLSCLFTNMLAQAVWEVNFERDKYGDVTSSGKNISGEFYGTFSNSVATDEKLNVGIGIDKDYFVFIFLEYGKYKPSFDTGWNSYIYIKKKDGTEEKIEVKQHVNMLTVLNEENREKLINLLKKESSLKCYFMEFTERSVRPSYNFIINCNGFTKAYKEASTSWQQSTYTK